jgi:hypothetical protein
LVIVKLQGGLGNQMFQYALGKVLSHRHKTSLLVDTSFYSQELANVDKRAPELDVFSSVRLRIADSRLVSSFYQYGRWDNRLRKIFGFPKRALVKEQNFRYDDSVLTSKPPVLLDGLFQTENYFRDCRSLILDSFSFDPFPPGDANAAFLRQISDCDAVAVHVRRGDYVKFAITNSFHGACSIEYYRNAVQLLRDRIPQAHFFFFSDDPDWVKEHLSFPDVKSTVISINKGRDSWKDMRLMSCCRHNIIANSSFSWWGAWLNRNEKKTVIAPARWFRSTDPFFDTRDVIPAEWIKLPNE